MPPWTQAGYCSGDTCVGGGDTGGKEGGNATAGVGEGDEGAGRETKGEVGGIMPEASFKDGAREETPSGTAGQGGEEKDGGKR